VAFSQPSVVKVARCYRGLRIRSGAIGVEGVWVIGMETKGQGIWGSVVSSRAGSRAAENESILYFYMLYKTQ